MLKRSNSNRPALYNTCSTTMDGYQSSRSRASLLAYLVTLDVTDKHYVGVGSLSANSAEVTAMSHLLLKVLEWKDRGDTMTDLAICYDSKYAVGWANSDKMGDTHVVAGGLMQGLRRAVEKEGVKIHFILK